MLKLLVVLLWVLPGASLAVAQEPEPGDGVQIVAVRAGFAGRYKVGCWTQFDVTIKVGAAGARGRVELTVADGDGVPSRVHAPAGAPLSIDAGQSATVPVVAKIGQLTSDVVVAFRGEDGTSVTRRFSTADSPELAGILSTEQQLIVAVGGPLVESDQLQFGRRETRIARIDNVGQLPGEWFGWESVDAVIVATGGEAISEQLATDSPQLAALEQWVRMGGTAVVSVGRQAGRVLASTSPLAALVPGRFEEVVPLRQSTALETFAETSEPLEGAGARFLLEVPKLVEVRGRIEAYAGSSARDLPLVVRAPHGFGEVVYLAADLAEPPLANWTAREQLFARLLDAPRLSPSRDENETLGQVTTLGFVDMAGQLRGALDQFEGVQVVPFWLVAVLIAAYVGIIGPLEYYLVKRVYRRPEFTWLTFAVTVLVFCGGAYGLTYSLKGRELRANTVDLVDYDAASGLVRGTSWANLFSPTSNAYDLALRPAPAGAELSEPPQALLSWMGLPGHGFGGMNPQAGSLPQFTMPYEFSGGLDRLLRVPVAIWSTKAFTGRWRAMGKGPIEADLADDGRLIGTLTCNLNEPLDDCVLIYDTWAYPLRTLEPGRRITIETELDPQTVETYLRHVTLRGDRDVAPPYDRGSFDVPRIVEIMSCHELAGGQRYTGLTNDFQEFIDLSELVQNGRAILIGRRARAAVELDCDGRPLADAPGQRWSFQRFVFPVRPAEAP